MIGQSLCDTQNRMGGATVFEPNMTCDERFPNVGSSSSSYETSSSTSDDTVATVVNLPEGVSCVDPQYFKDAYCDHVNNTPECQYDGGDCCEETCRSVPKGNSCGSNEFNCKNPVYMDTDTTDDVCECSGVTDKSGAGGNR
eukprot:UN32291